MQASENRQALHREADVFCSNNEFMHELVNLLHINGLTHKNVFFNEFSHNILCLEQMMDNQESQAEERRALLREVMLERGLTPTLLARHAGFRSPNVIYNFLNGYSSSLNSSTYQAIIDCMPGLTMNDLVGNVKTNAPLVFVKTHCQGNALRDEFSLQPSQMKALPLPVEDSARQAGAYAALVKRPGAEQIYPEGTILLCVPIDRFAGELTSGRRLIIERFQDKRIEVTVREIRAVEERFWLFQCSDDPRLQTTVKVPAELGSQVWRSGGECYSVAGVVIGAFIPE